MNFTRILILLLTFSIGEMNLGQGFAQERSPRLESALKALNQENHDRAGKIFVELVKEEPENALYWFNLANIFYKEGDYQRALPSYNKVISLESPLAPAAVIYRSWTLVFLEEFEKARASLSAVRKKKLPPNLQKEYEKVNIEAEQGILKPAQVKYNQGNYKEAYDFLLDNLGEELSPQTYLFKGMIELKLNKENRAQKSFKKALSSENENIRQVASNFLTMKEKIAPHPFILDASFLLGMNSNVFAEADEDNPLSSLYGRGTLFAQYSILRSTSFEVAPFYHLSWIDFFEAETAQETSHELGSQFSFNFSSWKFKVSPLIGMTTFEGETALTEAGVISSFHAPFGRNEFILTGGAIFKSGVGNFSHLSGNDRFFKTSLVRNFQRVRAEIFARFLSYESDDLILESGDVPLSFTGKGFGGDIYLLLTPETKLSFFGEILDKDYRFLEGREDTMIKLRSTLYHDLSKSWQFLLRGSFLDNSSTFDASTAENKNYSRIDIEAGIRWLIP